MACPSGNFARNTPPDVETTDAVKCNLCKLSVSTDQNPATGRVWFNVEFGPLQKEDGSIFETSIDRYHIAFVDQYNRFLPTNESILHITPTPKAATGSQATCCATTLYSAVVFGTPPTGWNKLAVTPVQMVAGASSYLPVPFVSGELTDGTSGIKKDFAALCSVTFQSSSAANTMKNSDAYKMVLREAIANGIADEDVTKKQVSVRSLWTTGAVVHVSMIILVEESKTKTDVALDGSALKTQIETLATNKAVIIHTITSASCGNAAGSLVGSSSRAPRQAILALTPFVAVFLAFFQ